MEIGIDAKKFGLEVPLGSDRDLSITEYAESLLDDPLIVLLRDLSRAGQVVLIPPQSGEEVELALDLAGVNAALWETQPALCFTSQEALWDWASNQAYLVDPTGAVAPINVQPEPDLKAERSPEDPAAFKVVIELRLGGTDTAPLYEVLVDGSIQATLSTISRRFNADLKKLLERLLTQEVRQRVKIALPKVADRTTLRWEVDFLRSALDARLVGYRAPVGNVASSIVQILRTHTDEDAKLSTSDLSNLRRQVLESVRRGKPVPVSISLAIGTRIPNPLKFSEGVNLPTYGWLHFAWFCEFINRKVQHVYEPGVRFLVFDEASRFAEMMPGVTPASVKQHLAATRKLTELMGAPIDIIEMTPEMLPWTKAKSLPAGVGPDVIYAIACSMPQMQDPEVMRYLYAERDRPYGQIQRQLGDLWQEAQDLAIKINKILALRKKPNWFVPGAGKVGLFQHLAFEMFGITEAIIDGCITVKEARLVLEPTSGVLLNHGMTVTARYPSGRHKVHICPEYRISDAHPTARPVRLDPKELGVEGDPFVFYYLVQSR